MGLAGLLAAVAFSIFVAFQLSLTFFLPETASLFSISYLAPHEVGTGHGHYLLGVGKADITG
jgi:hypothetical protein